MLNFLDDWLSGYISEELNDLTNLIKLYNKNKYLRALSFQLYEGNGILKRINVEDIVKAISKDERKIKNLGIKIEDIIFFYQKTTQSG